jgi:phosphoenolpyruvate carboxykinase (ATP)
MSLKHTRAILDAIHEGKLNNVEYEKSPIFELAVPKNVPGVPSEILNPRNGWADKAEYDKTLRGLA